MPTVHERTARGHKDVLEWAESLERWEEQVERWRELGQMLTEEIAETELRLQAAAREEKRYTPSTEAARWIGLEQLRAMCTNMCTMDEGNPFDNGPTMQRVKRAAQAAGVELKRIEQGIGCRATGSRENWNFVGTPELYTRGIGGLDKEAEEELKRLWEGREVNRAWRVGGGTIRIRFGRGRSGTWHESRRARSHDWILVEVETGRILECPERLGMVRRQHPWRMETVADLLGRRKRDRSCAAGLLFSDWERCEGPATTVLEEDGNLLRVWPTLFAGPGLKALRRAMLSKTQYLQDLHWLQNGVDQGLRRRQWVQAYPLVAGRLLGHTEPTEMPWKRRGLSMVVHPVLGEKDGYRLAEPREERRRVLGEMVDTNQLQKVANRARSEWRGEDPERTARAVLNDRTWNPERINHAGSKWWSACMARMIWTGRPTQPAKLVGVAQNLTVHLAMESVILATTDRRRWESLWEADPQALERLCKALNKSTTDHPPGYDAVAAQKLWRSFAATQSAYHPEAIPHYADTAEMIVADLVEPWRRILGKERWLGMSARVWRSALEDDPRGWESLRRVDAWVHDPVRMDRRSSLLGEMLWGEVHKEWCAPLGWKTGRGQKPMRVRRIKTLGELGREGREMRHCVGSYGHRVMSTELDIWHLEGKGSGEAGEEEWSTTLATKEQQDEEGEVSYTVASHYAAGNELPGQAAWWKAKELLQWLTQQAERATPEERKAHFEERYEQMQRGQEQQDNTWPWAKFWKEGGEARVEEWAAKVRAIYSGGKQPKVLVPLTRGREEAEEWWSRHASKVEAQNREQQ